MVFLRSLAESTGDREDLAVRIILTLLAVMIMASVLSGCSSLAKECPPPEDFQRAQQR